MPNDATLTHSLAGFETNDAVFVIVQFLLLDHLGMLVLVLSRVHQMRTTQNDALRISDTRGIVEVCLDLFR